MSAVVTVNTMQEAALSMGLVSCCNGEHHARGNTLCVMSVVVTVNTTQEAALSMGHVCYCNGKHHLGGSTLKGLCLLL